MATKWFKNVTSKFAKLFTDPDKHPSQASSLTCHCTSCVHVKGKSLRPHSIPQVSLHTGDSCSPLTATTQISTQLPLKRPPSRDDEFTPQTSPQAESTAPQKCSLPSSGKSLLSTRFPTRLSKSSCRGYSECSKETMNLQQITERLPDLSLQTTPPLLGRGSHGEVYLAQYKGEPCAVKVVHPILIEGILSLEEELYLTDSFENETEIMKSITHPNVVRYIDSSRENYALVMEKLDRSLYDSLSDKHLDKFKVLKDIASALAHIHKKKIMHGDLNPTNILLSGDGTAKLSDFGFSRHVTSELPYSGGNPVYMPHEIVSSAYGEVQLPSEKTDMFSFGLIILATYCGSLPKPDISERVSAATGRMIPERVRRSSLIRAVEPLMPEKLFKFAMQCIDCNPEVRPRVTDFPLSHSQQPAFSVATVDTPTAALTPHPPQDSKVRSMEMTTDRDTISQEASQYDPLSLEKPEYRDTVNHAEYKIEPPSLSRERIPENRDSLDSTGDHYLDIDTGSISENSEDHQFSLSQESQDSDTTQSEIVSAFSIKTHDSSLEPLSGPLHHDLEVKSKIKGSLEGREFALLSAASKFHDDQLATKELNEDRLVDSPFFGAACQATYKDSPHMEIPTEQLVIAGMKEHPCVHKVVSSSRQISHDVGVKQLDSNPQLSDSSSQCQMQETINAEGSKRGTSGNNDSSSSRVSTPLDTIQTESDQEKCSLDLSPTVEKSTGSCKMVTNNDCTKLCSDANQLELDSCRGGSDSLFIATLPSCSAKGMDLKRDDSNPYSRVIVCGNDGREGSSNSSGGQSSDNHSSASSNNSSSSQSHGSGRANESSSSASGGGGDRDRGDDDDRDNDSQTNSLSDFEENNSEDSDDEDDAGEPKSQSGVHAQVNFESWFELDTGPLSSLDPQQMPSMDFTDGYGSLSQPVPGESDSNNLAEVTQVHDKEKKQQFSDYKPFLDTYPDPIEPEPAIDKDTDDPDENLIKVVLTENINTKNTGLDQLDPLKIWTEDEVALIVLHILSELVQTRIREGEHFALSLSASIGEVIQVHFDERTATVTILVSKSDLTASSSFRASTLVIAELYLRYCAHVSNRWTLGRYILNDYVNRVKVGASLGELLLILIGEVNKYPQYMEAKDLADVIYLPKLDSPEQSGCYNDQPDSVMGHAANTMGAQPASTEAVQPTVDPSTATLALQVCSPRELPPVLVNFASPYCEPSQSTDGAKKKTPQCHHAVPMKMRRDLTCMVKLVGLREIKKGPNLICLREAIPAWVQEGKIRPFFELMVGLIQTKVRHGGWFGVGEDDSLLLSLECITFDKGEACLPASVVTNWTTNETFLLRVIQVIDDFLTAWDTKENSIELHQLRYLSAWVKTSPKSEDQVLIHALLQLGIVLPHYRCRY